MDSIEHSNKIQLALSNMGMSHRKSEYNGGQANPRNRIVASRNIQQLQGPKSVNRQAGALGDAYNQSPQAFMKMDSGPILGTEENSINDGDLNIMNNKEDGQEGRSQGQLTNCTGFFQNNISNDLLRKQNGSVLDEGTADGANMRASSASEGDLPADLKCRTFMLPEIIDPHMRNLT